MKIGFHGVQCFVKNFKASIPCSFQNLKVIFRITCQTLDILGDCNSGLENAYFLSLHIYKLILYHSCFTRWKESVYGPALLPSNSAG